MTTQDPKELGFSGKRLERIDKVLSGYVDSGKIAGVQVTVLRHGERAYSKCFGYRDKQQEAKLQDDTIYRIYSMSKPITSVAAMILYEEGSFRLDDPVARYIPWFSEPKVLSRVDEEGRMELVPAQTEMKIWHLLTHTSGLSYGFDQEDPLDALYHSRIYAEGAHERVPQLSRLVERVATLPLAHHPGTAWRYSFATDVLGYLVEVASGMPFADFLKKRIFNPLGMVDTGFYVPTDSLERFAVCYGPGSDGGLEEVPDQFAGLKYTEPGGLPSGGGGLVSTAADYARFAQMLLNGGRGDDVRLLGRKTVELMTSDHLGGKMHPQDDPSCGFGLGFAVLIDPTAARMSGSVGSYGWGGAANTDFWVDPVEDLVGLTMLQYMPSGTHPIVPDFKIALYSALVDD